jgi:hypothetical protein
MVQVHRDHKGSNPNANQSINAFLSQMLKWFLYPTYSHYLYFCFIEKKKYSFLVQFPLCHLTLCVSSKPGMCFANSLPTLFCYSSRSKFKISGLFIVAYVLPNNIIPRLCQPFLNLKVFRQGVYALAQLPIWTITTCQLTANICSKYSQLLSVYGGRFLHSQSESVPRHFYVGFHFNYYVNLPG